MRKVPFIFTSNPDEFHYADRWTEQGIEVVRRQGTHAIFGMRIPFIPSFLTNDFTRTLSGGDELSRIRIITVRQVRFLNDLINARSIAEGVAFDLRFIARPSEEVGRTSSIEIVLLGKVFHPNRNQAKNLALQLWRKVYSHYPLEDPFNYPLEVVDEHDLHRYMQPVAVGAISASQLIELRKFEDFDPYSVNEAFGYFPHPFRPAVDASAFGRFLETLVQQEQICVASICLQPTTLFHEELLAINLLLSRYHSMTNEANQTHGWLRTYRLERFEDLRATYDVLINKRNHLFKIKIQVLGEHYAPEDLLEALGSELMENNSREPRQWVPERPQTEDAMAVARYNFAFLEHGAWGEQVAERQIARLRSLVDSRQAVGAFRFPIPPESGYLPGLEVRDEPFVLPPERPPLREAYLSLGSILHRGLPSGMPFQIPVRDLNRHGLIAGATGSGKTNTCLHLLAQLWGQYQIPFLVMYPIDKPDYRLLMADPQIANQLLVYTIGDETTSPFRFNPFYVPDGILLKTHMSLLMRCFSAAFSMWDPLPAVYRAAIRQTYAEAGWDLDRGKGGDPNVRFPTMARFYEVLVAVSEEMTEDYDEEAKGRVRQSAEIRIRDLLLNAGTVVNTPAAAPMSQILQHPTVMELGRVGSPDDSALIMAFLLVQLVEELQSRYKQASETQRGKYFHVTLIEEAHRLMAEVPTGSSEDLANTRGKGGEDFANILAEVRGFGEGILIAEQIPTMLVRGALGNTNLKLMHRLEDQDSFKVFCEMMNLDERQRNYVRSLRPGQVVVRDVDSRPVFVQVGNYLDRFQTADDKPIIDDSDAAVVAMMRQRTVMIPPAQAWNPPGGTSHQTAAAVPAAPDDPQAIAEAVLAAANYALPVEIEDALAGIGDATTRWSQVDRVCRRLFGHRASYDAIRRAYLELAADVLRRSGLSVDATALHSLLR
jgi:hypothetical protein